MIEGWPAFTLFLGDLDPIEEFRGIQGRLRNLGFSCGRLDGKPGPRTEAALKEFQHQYDLDVTGKVDGQTRDKLKELHQS
jgi:peptidoglycan hydrolase-like protein with peptidoglycan-binding domain